MSIIMQLRNGKEYVPLSAPVYVKSKGHRVVFRRKSNAQARVGTKVPLSRRLGDSRVRVSGRKSQVLTLKGFGISCQCEKCISSEKRETRLEKTRRWARISLSRRFVRSNQPVDPGSVLVAGLSMPRGESHQGVILAKSKASTRFDRLVGNAKTKKKFLRICRALVEDLGMSVVGPLPFKILESMWYYFGEEHFAPHGRRCWCALCRSRGLAHSSFLERVGDVVYQYLVKMPLHVARSIVYPVPLKTARFVANKLWKWFNVLSEGLVASLVNAMPSPGPVLTDEEIDVLDVPSMRMVLANRLLRQRSENDGLAYHPTELVLRMAGV